MTFRDTVVFAALTLGLLLCASCGSRLSAGPSAAHGGVLADAFEAAFGKPPPFQTLDASGDRVIYSPQTLIDLPGGVVALISKAEYPGACESCGGSLGINYLRRGAAGFTRAGSWPDVGGKGHRGHVLPWTLRGDLDDGPTLVTHDDEHERDCASTTEELITLRPAGPVKIATVITATAYDPTPDDKHPPHDVGTITPVVRGKRFVVVFKGTDPLRQTFNREGDIFTTYNRGVTGC